MKPVAEPPVETLRTPREPLPRLTEAAAPLLREIRIVDETGSARSIQIPQERALTVFVDRRELVTLMTLGERPELLVLGYLLNQRLVGGAGEVEAVTVDWDVGAAAVQTRAGLADVQEKTARRIVTTGCGRHGVRRPDGGRRPLTLPDAASARIAAADLHAMLEAMRQRDSIHRKAGSVHGCALFRGAEMLIAIEDVGRHNAIDTIAAGWR